MSIDLQAQVKLKQSLLPSNFSSPPSPPPSQLRREAGRCQGNYAKLKLPWLLNYIDRLLGVHIQWFHNFWISVRPRGCQDVNCWCLDKQIGILDPGVPRGPQADGEPWPCCERSRRQLPRHHEAKDDGRAQEATKKSAALSVQEPHLPQGQNGHFQVPGCYSKMQSGLC